MVNYAEQDHVTRQPKKKPSLRRHPWGAVRKKNFSFRFLMTLFSWSVPCWLFRSLDSHQRDVLFYCNDSLNFFSRPIKFWSFPVKLIYMAIISPLREWNLSVYSVFTGKFFFVCFLFPFHRRLNLLHYSFSRILLLRRQFMGQK